MTAFFQFWLAAVLLFASWPLGCLGLSLIHALTGGRWGESLRVGLKRGVAFTPLILPMLIPLAFGLTALYPWIGGGEKNFYLNLPFLIVRLALYLILWLGLAFMLARRAPVSARLAGPALVLLILTANFWAIDAALSLDPHFNSSVFGLSSLAGMTIVGLSAGILLSPACGRDEVRDLSRLLLALVIFWAYLEFVQALIVWESDLAREIRWYVPRLSGAWGKAAWAIAVANFFVPFLALLTPAGQSSLRNLRAIAVLLIAGQAIYWLWVVLPSTVRHG